MEQLLYLSALFDFYGALLTEKQQECLKMHLFEDFSLSEIGEELGISRQAVYDNIHRSEKAMESYEAKLGLVRVTRRSARCSRTSAVRSRPCGRMRTTRQSAISSRASCRYLAAVNMAGRYDF